MTAAALACLGAACGAAPPKPPIAEAPPPPAPVEDAGAKDGPVRVGPIELEILHGTTAQTFHVVDQLSAWSPYSHPQYRAWADAELPLDDAEKTMLAAHAKLRHKRGWGSLDKAFDVDLPIDEAAARAVKWKLLTQADADAERALLEHFATKLAPLFAAHGSAVSAFEARVREEAPRASELAGELAILCDVEEPIHLPVVLVADPSDAKGSGAFHGGRLVVEVAGGGSDAMPTFLHELFHAVLENRRDQIAIAARECDDSLDPETLHEALAYAFAPGLVHAIVKAGETRDVLEEEVDRDAKEKRTLREPYVRFHRLGLAVRPLLADALKNHSKLHDLLPRACEAWGKIVREEG